jgi:hypothetical protein
MKFCDSRIVLTIFIIFKIFVFIIIPILIIKNKNREETKYIIYTDIILIVTILLCNMFTVNKCIYNSNFDGLKKSKIKSSILDYSSLHYSSENYEDLEDITANTTYKTYKGKDFYYYNQNDLLIKYNKLPCTEISEMYMNKYGSEITSVSMALSTILQRDISPVDLFELYTEYDSSECSLGIDIGELFSLVAQRYAGLNISEISSSEVIPSIKNEGIVIVELNPTGESNLSCGNNYIVVYNTTLEGNLIIADPSDSDYDFVCSSSSNAYGSTLKANRTSKEWDFDEINKDASHYYLIKGM